MSDQTAREECCAAFPDEADLAEHLAEHHPAAWERWYWGRYREEAAHRHGGSR